MPGSGKPYIPGDAFHELRETRLEMFPDPGAETRYLPPAFSEWTDEQLKRICFYLIEVSVNYKSLKSQTEVKPSTMKSYLLGIQRGFEQEWGHSLKILECPIFSCSMFELVSVLDNRFSDNSRKVWL